MNAKAKVIASLAVTGVLAMSAVFAFTKDGSLNAAQVSGPFSEEEREFINFIAKHRKNYFNQEEYNYRLDIFRENYNYIKEHNAAGHSSTLTVNHLADLSASEFKSNFLGLAPESGNEAADFVYLDTSATPSEWDWQKQGKVQAVKNQGQCGSCWAFATVGSIESLEAIKTGTLKSLSEQQLVDCSGAYGNQGCNGGWPDRAMDYVASTSGLESEQDYRYTARDGTCQYKSSKAVYKNRGETRVPNTPDQLCAAIHKNPVAVAIEADRQVFQFYHSGVITSSACGTQIDHAVLAVGYGTENGEPFYRIKNSWGTGWGDKGYVKISRKNNTCGILYRNAYPTA